MKLKINSPQFKFDFSKHYPLLFTVIFVLILFQYPFASLEAVFYDFRIKSDLGMDFKDNIVIITMDEESDEFLGESAPYTYASHERLLRRLIKDGPKVISYFVNLPNIGLDSSRSGIDQFIKTIREFKNQGGSFHFGTEIDELGGEQLPPKELQEFGYALAQINMDNASFSKDNVVRKALINVSGEDSLHLWAANEYRRFLKKDPLDVNSILGAYYDREADATFTLFKYYTSPLETNGKIKRIPFHRVVVGIFPKGFFTDKIVLLGSNYISNPDNFLLTPFNRDTPEAPKLAVHAQIIESLLQDKTIYAVPRNVSYIVAIILAIFLSIVVGRVRPSHGLLITVSTGLAIIVVCYTLFSIMGLWIYMSHMLLTVFLVYYIWIPFRAIEEYQTRFAIQEETKLLKQVEGLKQNFISLMSHDLKTPVAKIAGMADVMLHQHSKDESLAKGLRSIIDATKELNKFITSILDLTKVESHNLSLSKVSKDINQIVETVVEELKYEAHNKKIEVVSKLSPLYPIEVDVTLTKRVISNLIENAIKYAGEGKCIEVSTWDDPTWVYIKISDNGVGIKSEDLPHIFDKFFRVKNDANLSIKGSGLGLYLVKYFVELQGGQISVESTAGKGTAFQVKLKNA